MKQKSLLILGLPRSGTSLLASLVGAHPECVIMYEAMRNEENQILSDATFIGNKLCVPNHIQYHHPSRRVWFDLPDDPGLGLRLLRHVVEERVVQRIRERFLGAKWKDRTLSKMSISDYAKKRKSRFLFIVRDPNHVIDGIVRRRGAGQIVRWALGIREMHRAYCAFEGRSHVISFEKLVETPEKELEKICTFLSLEYVPDMREGYRLMPMKQYREKNKGIDKRAADRSVENYRADELEPEAYEKYLYLKERATSE